MAYSTDSVQWALHPRSGHWGQIVAAVFLTALILPIAAPAAPVAARSSCGTNWDSKSVPPPTVSVLRTKLGRVDVVPFREYVGKVLASGEFPTYDPTPVIQAGATAVKQYAWYYALKGNHRSSYVTANGTCYDVRDDTVDQEYTDRAHPTTKQLNAVAATWGLTLHKYGKFFLTGFRYGNNVPCAADADGWHLYEQSATHCAALGWSRQRIQEAYYRPRITFVWATGSSGGGSSDTTPPTVSMPSIQMLSGVQLAKVQVSVSWTATDSGSGLAGFNVQQRRDSGLWANVPLATPTTAQSTQNLVAGHTAQFRVRARDKAGNQTPWVVSQPVGPAIIQGSQAALAGTWSSSIDPGASGGSIEVSTAAGARASLTFTGLGTSVVAQLGPGHGSAQIRLDGTLVTTVSLEAPAVQERQVVWMKTWAKKAKHTLTVQVLAATGNPPVNVDAFVILR